MTFAVPVIVPIVEGPGDEAATPVLLRRILYERLGRYDLDIVRPKKAKDKGALIKRLENFLLYARKTPGCAGILALFIRTSRRSRLPCRA